ncbi:reticulon domain-containing protein [Babesia ovata]|uniref:Reticulon domain-containing protein n=1 Tax=Babesia ovata TaxID=189622 RepID=A0A2H6KC04_9APIC|nr:reticulon domain-containing protein [Babesia ovata]GBE60517.1 reticulon domain-containing protein [Babesia ovata]
MLCNKTLCNDSEEGEKHEFVKSETIAGVLQCTYTCVNCICGEIRTIFLWRYPMKSVYALVVLYIVGLSARVLSFPVLVFLMVWTLCGWLSFREHYYEMVHPQVKPIFELAGNAARGLYASIPKFKESQKL